MSVEHEITKAEGLVSALLEGVQEFQQKGYVRLNRYSFSLLIFDNSGWEILEEWETEKEFNADLSDS